MNEPSHSASTNRDLSSEALIFKISSAELIVDSAFTTGSSLEHRDGQNPECRNYGKRVLFFVPSDSRTWFNESKKEIRMAAINGMGSDGTSAHVILSEEPGQAREKNEYLAALPLSLFLLTENTIDDFLKELGELT